MHAGKAKSPGEVINWLTMTLPGALCLTGRLKETVLRNVQQNRPEKKQAYLDTKLQVGKKILCPLIYQFTGSVTHTCAIKLG